MFSVFNKDKSPSFPVRDKVWKTAEAAQRGLLMMAMMRLQQQLPALIISFFEEDKQRLISFMDENKIEFKELNLSSSTDDMNAPQVYIIGEEAFHSSVVADLLSRTVERLGKTVYFQGHYPIIEEENKILFWLSNLGFSDFVFCLSFDDPMMTTLKGNIVPLLESLGLEENEAIEHNMVTSAIKNFRKKINEKVKIEKKTKSAAEWFALNVKS